jgi:hypothetical protein
MRHAPSELPIHTQTHASLKPPTPLQLLKLGLRLFARMRPFPPGKVSTNDHWDEVVSTDVFRSCCLSAGAPTLGTDFGHRTTANRQRSSGPVDPSAIGPAASYTSSPRIMALRSLSDG